MKKRSLSVRPKSVGESSGVRTETAFALLWFLIGTVATYIILTSTSIKFSEAFGLIFGFLLSFIFLLFGIFQLLICLKDYSERRRAEKIKDIKSLLKLKRVQLKRGLPKEIRVLEQKLEKLKKK